MLSNADTGDTILRLGVAKITRTLRKEKMFGSVEKLKKKKMFTVTIWESIEIRLCTLTHDVMHISERTELCYIIRIIRI